MTPEALDSAIESEWFALRRAKRPRTYYLTPDDRLLWGYGSGLDVGREVGTYTATVEFEDFRADCLHVAQPA